jgi:hypothetical protein
MIDAKQAKKPHAGGNPGFDERSPDVQKNKNWTGGNPLFDESGDAVKQKVLANLVNINSDRRKKQ